LFSVCCFKDDGKVTSRYERQRREQEEFQRNEFKNAELLRKKQRLEERKVSTFKLYIKANLPR